MEKSEYIQLVEQSKNWLNDKQITLESHFICVTLNESIDLKYPNSKQLSIPAQKALRKAVESVVEDSSSKPGPKASIGHKPYTRAKKYLIAHGRMNMNKELDALSIAKKINIHPNDIYTFLKKTPYFKEVGEDGKTWIFSPKRATTKKRTPQNHIKFDEAEKILINFGNDFPNRFHTCGHISRKTGIPLGSMSRNLIRTKGWKKKGTQWFFKK